jgi:hypothetical protein
MPIDTTRPWMTASPLPFPWNVMRSKMSSTKRVKTLLDLPHGFARYVCIEATIPSSAASTPGSGVAFGLGDAVGSGVSNFSIGRRLADETSCVVMDETFCLVSPSAMTGTPMQSTASARIVSRRRMDIRGAE